MKTQANNVTMKMAHSIARNAVEIYGGKHSEYFASALKQAHEIFKLESFMQSEVQDRVRRRRELKLQMTSTQVVTKRGNIVQVTVK